MGKGLAQRMNKAVGIASLGLAGLLSSCLSQYGEQLTRNVGETIIYTAVSQGIKGQLNPDAYPTQVNVYSGGQADYKEPGISRQGSQSQSLDIIELNIYKIRENELTPSRILHVGDKVVIGFGLRANIHGEDSYELVIDPNGSYLKEKIFVSKRLSPDQIVTEMNVYGPLSITGEYNCALYSEKHKLLKRESFRVE
jgi:hypothetical protein